MAPYPSYRPVRRITIRRPITTIMIKLYFTIILSIILLALLPFSQQLACSPHAPLYTHFVYMFGHASFLHWACNCWSLLALHNLFRPSRLIMSYALSVLISFLPVANVGSGVIGISVVVCFFVGFLSRYLYHTNRSALFMTVAVLVGSCFLPGFAGYYHIIMFTLGALYNPVEGFFLRLMRYLSHD